MSFRDYLASKAIGLCMGAIGMLYLSLIFWLCGLSLSLLLILLLSGALVLLVCVLIGWRRTDRRLRALRRCLDALPERYLIGETLQRPRDAVELEYYLLMKEISRSAIGAVEQARSEMEDYCDYVVRWVHEIKTPLTACSLILANGGDSSKLRRELRRADNLSETILSTLDEERRRFAILYRLGADERTQKSALRRQIGAFFLAPFAFPLLMTVPMGLIFGKVYEIWDFGLNGWRAMETAVLIALVVAGAYVLYFLITYFIACSHVICHGAEADRDPRAM